MTLAVLTTTRWHIARRTENNEEATAVIADATAALAAKLPLPLFETTMRLYRLTALRMRFVDDAKAALAAYPQAPDWVRRAATLLPSAQDAGVNRELIAWFAGELLSLDIWLSFARGVPRTGIVEFIARARSLIALAMTWKGAPQDWHKLLCTRAEQLENLASIAVGNNDGDAVRFDHIAAFAKSAKDPEAKTHYTMLLASIPGMQGARTGNLQSLDAATRGLRQYAATGLHGPVTIADITAQARLFEFAQKLISSSDPQKLALEPDELVMVLAGTSEVDITPVLTLMRNYHTTLRTAAVPNTVPPPIRPDDPWLPVWRLADLLPRLVIAVRRGQVGEVDAISSEIDQIRRTTGEPTDIVSMSVALALPVVASPSRSTTGSTAT